MRLSAYLFGAPRIELDDQPVQVDTRKAIALFAYLAITGASHSREHLAALLWPDYDTSHAYAALRRTLSSLHKALGGQGLLIERERIGLDKNEQVWIDVDEFRALIARADTKGYKPAPTESCAGCLQPLTDAASLYQDDFLAGFSLRDSAAFDDWQFFQAESLRRELAGILEKLVDLNTRIEADELAIRYARRWLALDPLNELAHQQLMCVYAWAGLRNAALRQYQECAQVLERELGIAPLAETTRLYQDIKADHLPPRPGRAAAQAGSASQAAARPENVSPTPQYGYPLVGRSGEWSQLRKIYSSEHTGGSFVVLEGEAGAGKTRLAEDFLASLRSQGVFVISARCYQGEGNLAYGPFIDVLRGALSGALSGALRGALSVALERSAEKPWWEGMPAHWLSEVSRLLPELIGLIGVVPPAAPLESPGAQSHFYESISQVLLALCGGCKLSVLFLDDLHWADESSIDLLFYLIRRLDHLPVHILATWRSEQVPGEHRLRDLLAESQRSGVAYQIPVARLAPDAVNELTRKILPGEAQLLAELSERLYQETEGLPFFLVEYLSGIASGRIDLDAPGWSLPNGVRDLIRSRLKNVEETGWQLLQAAAVLGRSFDFEVLRLASGRSDDETVTALEELIHLSLISETSSTAPHPLSYDFSHDKIRAWVYEETSQTRRRLLHRRAADALFARARSLPDAGALAGQIAFHYKQAGLAKEAASFYHQAGEHAVRLYANADALAHFKAALALGHPDLAGLNEAIGNLHLLRGEYVTALSFYENAAALQTGSSTDLGRIEHKRGEIHRRLGDWDLAEHRFQSAAQAFQQANDPVKLSHLFADWSHVALQQGQAVRALELAEQALHLAEGAKDPSALVQAYNVMGILVRSQGDYKQASQYLERSLELANQQDNAAAQIAALNNLALVHADCDEPERAIELDQAALELCILQGDRHREAALHNNLADLYHKTGQDEASMVHLKQAVIILAEIGVEAGNLKPEIWRMVDW